MSERKKWPMRPTDEDLKSMGVTEIYDWWKDRLAKVDYPQDFHIGLTDFPAFSFSDDETLRVQNLVGVDGETYGDVELLWCLTGDVHDDTLQLVLEKILSKCQRTNPVTLTNGSSKPLYVALYVYLARAVVRGYPVPENYRDWFLHEVELNLTFVLDPTSYPKKLWTNSGPQRESGLLNDLAYRAFNAIAERDNTEETEEDIFNKAADLLELKDPRSVKNRRNETEKRIKKRLGIKEEPNRNS